MSLEEVRLSEDSLFVAPRPYRILCLTGGGYRGLYTAALLEKLEAEADKPLASIFDLIAGTSIGGILALGLAAGVSARKLAASFEANADLIFPRHARFGPLRFPRLLLDLLGAKYPNIGLKQTIQDILNAKMNDAVGSLATKVLISSVDLNSGEPRIFSSSDACFP